jgi:MFS family permease
LGIVALFKMSHSPDAEFSPGPVSMNEASPLLSRGQQKYEGTIFQKYIFVMALNSFALLYGAAITSFGIIILPVEMGVLFPTGHALSLSVALGIAGVSQLICPIAGFLSDNHVSVHGKRRIPMVAGTVGSVIGLICLAYCRQQKLGHAYLVVFGISMCFLNIAYSVWVGLVADVVCRYPELNRLNSSFVGAFQMLGSVGGVVGIGYVFGVENSYVVFSACAAICCLLVSLAYQERPNLEVHDWSAVDIIDCFRISPTSHGDFFWVFVSRTLYYMGVSAQCFCFYYLRDILGTSDPTRDTATQASVSQIFAAFAAILVSNHLDTYGKKNIIRCACVVLCSVYIFYAFTTSFMQCLVLVTFYGIGNGIYLAADFSMAVDALPDPSKRARDMGLWGVAAFIGCMLGPCIGGPLLELFGHTLAAPSTVHDARYARSGFVILMLSGCLWSFLSALTLRFVTVGEPVQPKVLDQETD